MPHNPSTALQDKGLQALAFAPIVLLLVVLLGLFVRLHGITRESIWWDEYTSVIHLEPPRAWQDSLHYDRWQLTVAREDSPSLWAFLKKNRSMDPATMPLYYAFEYLAYNLAGRSILGLRLLSVFIGILLIPAVYLFGRDLFGKNAGLIAAFCLALSPIHRQFSVEIRMYGLMTLLALLSAYTFMHLVRDGQRRWWLLHAAADLFLFWTHPFAVLIPFVEGVFWVLSRPKDYRRIAAWVGMHAMLVLPVVIYISTIRFWSLESTSSWMRLPALRELAGDLFADDCIGMTYQLRANTGAWEFFLIPACAKAIVASRWLVGRWMVGAFLLAALWVAVRSVWEAWRQRNVEAASCRFKHGSGKGPWAWSFFLLLWWLLPPLVLYAVSMFWRPCIMPRYTLHSSIALYLILGGAIVLLPRRYPKILAFCVLAAFYGYQQMLVLGGPQHTDYRSAAQHIRAEAKPDDLILVHNELWKRVFAYNLGPAPNVIAYAKTFDVLAEECAFFIGLNKPSIIAPGGPCQVWAVIRTDYFESGPYPQFEKELTVRNLAFRFYEFGGIQHVLVYHVFPSPSAPSPMSVMQGLPNTAVIDMGELALEFWRARDYDAAAAASKHTIRIDPGYSRAHTYLGMALKEKGESGAALAAFQDAVALDPADYPWSFVNIGMLLTDNGRYTEAVAALEKAIMRIPNNSWAYTCLGNAYHGKGDTVSAIAAYQKAIALDPGDQRPREELEEATQVGSAPRAAANGDPR